MKEIIIKFKIPEIKDWPALKSYLFYCLKYVYSKLKLAIIQVYNDFKSQKVYSGLVLAVFGLIAWQFSLTGGIFWALFVSFWLFRWDSRLIAAGALLSLSACPFLLAGKKDAWAEQMAIYAYYFLVMTVALQIAEAYREKKGEAAVAPAGNDLAYDLLAKDLASPALAALAKERPRLAGLVYWKNLFYHWLIRQPALLICRLETKIKQIRLNSQLSRKKQADQAPLDLEIEQLLEKEFASPPVSQIEPLPDYAEYLRDSETREFMGDQAAAGLAAVSAINKLVKKIKSAFSLIWQWTRNTVKIILSAFHKGRSIKARPEKIVFSRTAVMDSSAAKASRFGSSPDFAGEKQDKDFTLARFVYLNRASRNYAPAAASLTVLAIGGYGIWQSLAEGDPFKIFLKLLLITVAVILTHLLFWPLRENSIK